MRDGKFPRASRALLADAIGTMVGALTGTSTVTSYIESAAGVAAGARTGLGNVLAAGLFASAMFCAPIVNSDSLVRHSPGTNPCRRADVHIHCENPLGRSHRRLPRFHDHGGNAPDLQHRHWP